MLGIAVPSGTSTYSTTVGMPSSWWSALTVCCGAAATKILGAFTLLDESATFGLSKREHISPQVHGSSVLSASAFLWSVHFGQSEHAPLAVKVQPSDLQRSQSFVHFPSAPILPPIFLCGHSSLFGVADAICSGEVDERP